MKKTIRKAIRIFTKLLFVLVIAALGFAIWKKGTEVPAEAPKAEVQAARTDPKLEEIMNEESFRKMTELRARRTLADRQKSEENARHDAAIKAVESELENIRKEELELDGNASSLE